ncbi:MAG: type VI secretion system tube protein Hcp [Aquabacterium sp.]|nr:MAG: type VI secretion system tube protein Hcp [Aquabacterium sp.]
MPVAELYMSLKGQGGPVKGDCEAEGYEGQIQLFDWSWALDVDSDNPQSKKAQAQPTMFMFSKYFDRASTPMMNALRSGEVFPEARITLVHRIDLGMTILVILRNVRVAGYDLSVKSDKSVDMDEDWVLDYTEVEIQYVARGGGGAKVFRMEKKPSTDMKLPFRNPPMTEAEEAIAELQKQAGSRTPQPKQEAKPAPKPPAKPPAGPAGKR